MMDIATARIVVVVMLVMLAFAIAAVITLLGRLREAQAERDAALARPTTLIFPSGMFSDGSIVAQRSEAGTINAEHITAQGIEPGVIGPYVDAPSVSIVGDAPLVPPAARLACRFPQCACRFPGAICDANGRDAARVSVNLDVDGDASGFRLLNVDPMAQPFFSGVPLMVACTFPDCLPDACCHDGRGA